MTILAKFPLGTFSTSNVLDNDFEYYYEMAEDGATHYSDSSFNIVATGFALFIPIFIFIGIFSINRANNTTNNFVFGSTGNKVPKDVPLFRDIPCRKDIFRAYFIAYNYNLMKKKTDFLGAILLKWLKENKIKIEKKEVRKNI